MSKCDNLKPKSVCMHPPNTATGPTAGAGGIQLQERGTIDTCEILGQGSRVHSMGQTSGNF